MQTKSNPITNPMIIHRKEPDGWAILFDPDNNKTYALDPVSSFIWNHLDGQHSNEDMLHKLNDACEGGIPNEAPQDLQEFLDELEKKSLIGYQI